MLGFADRKARMSENTLKNYPLHKVLLSCFQEKRTGLIVVKNDEHKKIIYVEKGQPKGCRSNITKETLGQRLVKNKKLPQAELSKILKEFKQSDGFPLGAKLIELGHISPEDLASELEEQLKDRVFDLFTWKDGNITMRPPQDSFAKDGVPLTMSTPTLIFEGIILSGNANKEIDAIDGSRIPVMMQGGVIKKEELQISGNDAAFMNSIRGTQNLDELSKDAKVDAKRCREIVYALKTLGMLRYDDEAPPEHVASTDVPTAVNDSEQPKQQAAASKPNKDADGSFSKKVTEKMKELEGKNHFEVLGVDQGASDAEIRKIYFKFAKEFHPDKLRGIADESIRSQGERLFAMISDAFNTLTDADKKKKYLETLDYGSDDATDEAVKILESEALFTKGRGLIRQGEFRAAQKILEQAIEYHPDEPEYHLYLGWSLYKIGAADGNDDAKAKGKALLEKHKEARKRLEVGFLFLGQIAKLENKIEQAERMFLKALDIKPNCHEAERELRLIDMRRDKKSKGFGFFKKK